MKICTTDRIPYATDGIYRLYRLVKEDKEPYMELLKENNTTPGYYDDPFKANLMWELAINGCEFSIVDNEGNYCGNIILKHTESKCPEIGVDIVKRYRNQGIAPRAIKMLANEVYKKHSVDYFLLRASEDNLHSIHMIEKLGAVSLCDTKAFYLQEIDAIKEVLGEEAAISYMNSQKDKKQIYHYKYLPEQFLTQHDS